MAGTITQNEPLGDREAPLRPCVLVFAYLVALAALGKPFARTPFQALQRRAGF